MILCRIISKLTNQNDKPELVSAGEKSGAIEDRGKKSITYFPSTINLRE